MKNNIPETCEEVKKELIDVCQPLFNLQSPEHIRLLLVAKGIKGYKNSCAYCPIAIYISDIVKNKLNYIKAYQEQIGAFSNCNTGGCAFIKTSEAIRQFIINFDSGKYPELIKTNNYYTWA